MVVASSVPSCPSARLVVTYATNRTRTGRLSACLQLLSHRAVVCLRARRSHFDPFRIEDESEERINKDLVKYHDSLVVMRCHIDSCVQYQKFSFRGRKKFKFLMNLERASSFVSSYQGSLAMFCASLKAFSSVICHYHPGIHLSKLMVNNVMCRQKHFGHCIGSFIHMFASIILIISISMVVSKAPTWALTEENRLFLEAWRTIDRAYFDKTFNGQNWFRYRENALRTEPMNNREETYKVIQKMLSTLDDPFTRFLEPEKFKNLRSSTQGELIGVGLSIGYHIRLDVSSTGIVVISASPGGPANKSGIKPGDNILAIDDRSTEDMDIYEAAELLQGTEGSTVKLEIRRGSEIRHMVLRREKITLNPVKSRFCEVAGIRNDGSHIGYIKLTSFNKNASVAVRNAVETLRDRNVNSFVLDLRDNSGGLFPEGIETAKIWLDKGVIVYICDNRGVRDIYEADGSNAIAVSEPLIVLVNKGTASASEILAGALKDNKRAVLYGEPTFGKGKIQSIFELSDGSGLAVTVARYETPGHTDIDKVGITPDHPLPPSFPLDEDSFCDCFKDSASTCSLNTAAFLYR
ncbi:hypothetical protein HPP92_022078 [Vanilla planifolia]|uniref:C-terminal processing peptidase n=1 Tax=Vanilla planifolia TaxID=51239 RepID=A0A835PMW2_VANPL|nr:hypothetical protein HPP92_022078 [Vanilla planifolia]